jgi:ParB family transcriptional regulator, chromosome partitioning protein
MGLPDLGSKKKVPKAITHEDSQPLELKLGNISADPDQPRSEFDEKKLNKLANNIKRRGVRTPISVAPHPKSKDKYIINHGERRFRACKLAGLMSIPAFIDKTHIDYDQISENIHREDLTPMELAIFINKKIKAKVSKKDIAENLDEDASTITHHLSLIDAPDCIDKIYRSGRCVSPRTIYELRAVYNKFPDEITHWCETDTEITRKTVKEIKDQLNNPGSEGIGHDQESQKDLTDEKIGHDQKSQQDSTDKKIGHDQESQQDSTDEKIGHDQESQKDSTDEKIGHDQECTDDYESSPLDNSEACLSSWPKGSAVADPQRMTKPLLIVEYDKRFAAIILNKKPTAEGFVYIQYQDNGAEEEVDAANCVINRLYEP